MAATHDGVWSVTVTDANGCTATDQITITVLPNPANDACSGAIAVSMGANNSLSNECATADLTPCTGAQNDASVWYSYTIPDGLETIEIATSNITGAGVAVYQSNCTTLIQADCDGTIVIDCPVGQSVRIMVTTSTADMDDDFTMTITETAQSGNDICSGATVLDLVNPVCGDPNVFNQDNTGACPELTSVNFGGCDFTTGPATWYSFTTDANTDVIDISVTGIATNFGLFAACGGASVAGSCTTDGTLVNQAVSANTQYFLVIAGDAGAEGPFVINITEKTDPPANSLCADAIALNDNTPVNGTTSCAPTWNVDFCGIGTTNSHTVFYTYTVPASNTTNVDLTFSVTANTLTSGTPATGDINIGLFTNCTGSVYTANVESGSLCTALGSNVVINCVAPGTVLTIAIGSEDGNEGDFSINVNESNIGIPVNDLCTEAITITLDANCEFEAVTGDSENACPELFAGSCDLDDFPTVWYEVTLPAGGVGFAFDNITGGANISILSNNCAAPTVFGTCITAPGNSAALTPGTYLLAVRTDATGGDFGFDIKSIVPPANDLCADAVTLADDTPVNGTTACATPWSVSHCGLNTTTSHTVFYKYTVPATNTTNVDLVITLTGNTATTGTAATVTAVGFFTNCTGTTYTANIESGNPCTILGAPVTLNCVAPGTEIIFAVGSPDGDEGDFSINVNETNTGIPANDLCASAQVITFDDDCEFEAVAGNTENACPEAFAGTCDLDDFPTVWYQATIPAGGVGFTFDNLTGNPNISILSNSCSSPSTFGTCITATTSITTLTPGTYLIAVRTNNSGGAFGFDIKTIVPPANDLCAMAIALSDNTPINGTTACATPFTTSFCGLNTTTSHTVFYTYTVPASNTTNTNLEFTLTPNTATTGTAAVNDLNVGLFTGCTGTVYDASIGMGNPCTALGASFTIECVAPGTVITIAVGSSDGDEGDFSITVDEDNAGIPTNDLCSNPTVITIVDDCEFQTVNGTAVDACPEVITNCDFDDFPTVWYEVELPANGIGFSFEDLSPGLNIGVFNNACPPTTIFGSCVTGVDDVDGLTPGTYLIAVRNTDPGAVFNFDIKTILFLPNDEPCGPGFVATSLTSGNALANQNNSCATDDRTCSGDPVTNSLWYSFTLGSAFDRITVNVTGLTNPSIAIYPAGNPCSSTVINEECEGDGEVDFNCLAPGTYNIFVGTSSANAGEFTITATEGNNAGPVNDLCNAATVINIDPMDLCVNLPFESSNINACPDNVPSFGACNFATEETSWYTFTAPGVAGDMPTMDFTFTGYTGTGTPFMNVFSGSCASLTAVESQCFQGVGTVFGNIGPLTPGTQYWIGISSTGDTGGDFDFTVKFNLGPPNDDKCHSASGFDLGSNGTGLGPFTNVCAGGDYTIPDCAPATSENSVWFTFTVDPGSYGVRLFVWNHEPGPNNGIQGQLSFGVFEDGCGSNIVEITECGQVRMDVFLDCLEPGTYDLQMAGPTATSGDFTIDIEQLSDDRSCPDGPLPDDCVDAVVINMDGIYCSPIPTASCNIGACPETFNLGGCQFGVDPTVWYTFTVDGDAASIDILNMTGGFYYALFTGTPCTSNAPTAIAPGCMMNPNTLNIPVVGGTTYWLAVANPSDGQFSFEIVQNVFPENDDPDPSSPRPPHVLTIGDSHESATCCALGFADGAGLDVPNVSCASASHDGAVWYRYTTGSEVGFEVTVTGGNISGPTTVEILSGSATAPGTSLFQPTSVSCGPLPVTLKVGCFDPGEEVWIKVASANDDCGTFTISLDEINQCPLAEECDDAETFMTNPTDVECGTFIPIVIEGCLEAACPETEVNDCGNGMLPTVWFHVVIDDEAVQLGTSIETSGTWDPVWAIYYGGCGSLSLANGGTISEPTPCSNGDSNPFVHTVGTITGELDYWIAVSGDGIIDDPNFNLNVWTSADCVSCIGEDGCAPKATWTITSRSSDRPLDDPLFCQGEDVTVCIEYTYDASETGVDWLHGLTPNFGPGWDMEAFDPTAVSVSPGNPEWADEMDGSCAPFITEQMPYLCTYTDPVTGQLKLCHTGCQICPCVGPLRAGSSMPSGWYWNSNGGAGCLNDCSPSTHWGIGQVVVDINFCVDLKVRVFDDPDECNLNKSLQFDFQTTSDGVSGCWEDPVAECRLDFAQVGPKWEIDCRRPPKVLGNDFELCTEGMVEINLTNEEGLGDVTIEVTAIDNPNVTGENNHNFSGGSGTIDDYLTNTGTNIEIVEYICQSTRADFICPSPSDTFRVTIYPPVVVYMDNQYRCSDAIEPTILTPNVTGGTGNYVGTTVPFAPGYEWSTGQTTTSINVMPFATESYTVTVTDDKGCSGTGQVEVEVKLPVTFDLEPPLLNVCGGFDDEAVTIENITANSPNVTVSWNIPTGLSAIPSGQTLLINPGASSSTFSPYTVSASVADAFGCTGINSMVVIVSEPPQATLEFDPFPCGTSITDLHVENWYNPFGNQVRITLLDCNGNIVQGTAGNNPIFSTSDGQNVFDFFDDVNLSIQNCFVLKMESLDPGSQEVLCEVLLDPLTIPVVNGTPIVVTPAASICTGNSITVGITSNTAPTTTYVWSPAPLPNTKTINVSPTATTQYSVTATQANGCTSVGSVVVTVNALPVGGITGATQFCPGSSTELTASGGTSYAWSGPSGFTASTANTGPINVNNGLYVVTVTDANGCTDTESVTITENAQILVTIAPLELCDNMVDTLDAGTGFDTYVWKDANGTIIGNSQKVGVTQAGTYTLEVTKGSCSGMGTANVTNSITPTTNLPDTISVCRLAQGTGEHPSIIDFTALSNPVPGTWINTEGVTVNTSNWSSVDFTASSMAGDYYFHFITSNAIAPCSDVMDSVLVNINNCLCPTPSITFSAVCNDRDNPIALDRGFANQSFATNYPGTWSVVAGTQPYPQIVNDSLIVLGSTPGLYTLRYTIATPLGTCPLTFDAPITIEPASTVTGSEIVLCNQNIGAGPTSVNLSTLLSNLVEPSPGSWTLNGNPVTNTTIDAIGSAPDTLIYTYTTTSILPCLPQMADVTVRIRNCDCPEITLVPDTLCNATNLLINLEDATRFTALPSSVTGTWAVTAPLVLSNGKFYNPNGIAASSNYEATFSISGNLSAGCQRDFTKKILIRDQPIAVKRADPNVCSVNTGNGPTSINLFSQLQAGYTTGGTWTQISPASPQLPVIAGNVDFLGQVVGTQFVYRYALDGREPCSDVNVDITITVSDCNCPNGDIACSGGTDACDLCNDNDILDLSTLIVDPAIFTPGGIWTVTGPSNLNVPLNGTLMDAKDLPFGKYVIRYTIVPAPSGSCPKFDEIEIRVQPKATGDITPDTLVCNGPTGITEFNISLLNPNGVVGTWKDENGTPVIQPYLVNIAGLAQGSQLNFTYTIDNPAPCENTVYPVVVNITNNCDCPPIVLGSIPPLCTNLGTFDLKPISAGTTFPGRWTTSNPNVNIVGDVIQLTGMPPGVYTVRYELINVEAGCLEFKDLNFTVSEPKSAGVARGASFCLGATDVVSLFDRLDDEDTGGIWTVISGGTQGFNASVGTFALTGRPAGTYVFRYAFTQQSPCPDDSEDVTIIINPIPVADAGTDKKIDCDVQDATLGTANTSTGTNIVYEWKLNNAIVATTSTYKTTNGGTYTLTVMDTVTKCSASDIVIVDKDADIPTFKVEVDTIACFGEVGKIEVLDITGGKQPYQISFDGGTTYGNIATLSNLKNGTYDIKIKDANGCVVTYPTITIVEPPLFTIKLVDDFELLFGDDSLLVVQGSIDLTTVPSIVWKANGEEIVSNKNNVSYLAKPEKPTTYTVTATNESGCIAIDELNISIKRLKPECVPNIISANSEGENNYFSINCDEVELVTKYSIYDRWGNLMFVGKDLKPTEPQTFWDGKFKGKPVVPGVYVYSLELLFKDGSREIKAGDVTVIDASE